MFHLKAVSINTETIWCIEYMLIIPYNYGDKKNSSWAHSVLFWRPIPNGELYNLYPSGLPFSAFTKFKSNSHGFTWKWLFFIYIYFFFVKNGKICDSKCQRDTGQLRRWMHDGNFSWWFLYYFWLHLYISGILSFETNW